MTFCEFLSEFSGESWIFQTETNLQDRDAYLLFGPNFV